MEGARPGRRAGHADGRARTEAEPSRDLVGTGGPAHRDQRDHDVLARPADHGDGLMRGRGAGPRGGRAGLRRDGVHVVALRRIQSEHCGPHAVGGLVDPARDEVGAELLPLTGLGVERRRRKQLALAAHDLAQALGTLVRLAHPALGRPQLGVMADRRGGDRAERLQEGHLLRAEPSPVTLPRHGRADHMAADDHRRGGDPAQTLLPDGVVQGG